MTKADILSSFMLHFFRHWTADICHAICQLSHTQRSDTNYCSNIQYAQRYLLIVDRQSHSLTLCTQEEKCTNTEMAKYTMLNVHIFLGMCHYEMCTQIHLCALWYSMNGPLQFDLTSVMDSYIFWVDFMTHRSRLVTIMSKDMIYSAVKYVSHQC